jgi:hypothetical protein
MNEGNSSIVVLELAWKPRIKVGLRDVKGQNKMSYPPTTNTDHPPIRDDQNPPKHQPLSYFKPTNNQPTPISYSLITIGGQEMLRCSELYRFVLRGDNEALVGRPQGIIESTSATTATEATSATAEAATATEATSVASKATTAATEATTATEATSVASKATTTAAEASATTAEASTTAAATTSVRLREVKSNSTAIELNSIEFHCFLCAIWGRELNVSEALCSAILAHSNSDLADLTA